MHVQQTVVVKSDKQH